MGISVVINTLNEEANISDCIKSVQGLADEIVVCDMYSDDRTVEIARELGAKIFFHERVGFVEPARRFAISNASHEWVLSLDADERMTENLANHLRATSKDNKCDVVTFWSRYWYFGDWVMHGGFYNNIYSKFFRKEFYMKSYSADEETLHHNFNVTRGSKNQVFLPDDCYIDHYAYETIEKYIQKTLGKYARIEAEQHYANKRPFRLWRLAYDPCKTFIQCFLLKRGYKDGIRGFILAVLYSMYYFSIWANVWLLEEQAAAISKR